MERSWEYVQERINLIQEMNGNIKDRSHPQSREQVPEMMTYMAAPSSGSRSGMITMMAPSSQRQRDLSQLLMNPSTIPEHMKPLVKYYPELSSVRPTEQFKEPVVFDESGICSSGVCQYVPKSKPVQEHITWIEGNNQVSFQPPPPPQTTPLKVLFQQDQDGQDPMSMTFMAGESSMRNNKFGSF